MPNTNDQPLVAVVLPPREGFSTDTAGAIGLLARRLCAAPSAYRRIIIGSPCPAPFPGLDFRPARPALLPLSRLGRYARGVARQAKGAALIEVHNQPRLAVALTRLCPAARVTLFLHNDPLAMRGLRRPAERARAARRLAGFACVSSFLTQRLRAVLPAARCVTLPNCIDLAELPPPANPRAPLILFAGRLTADKGADSFVAACALALPHLPGWRAEMIGADRFSATSPATPFTRTLTHDAARAGVRLAGYQPHAAVLQAMARASIVVVPSRWQEPFGLTALEAMASGASLVCSGRGGLDELIGRTGFRCDPDAPQTIADAIVQAAATPGTDTSRHLAAKYDISLAAAALDAWRRKVLGQGSALDPLGAAPPDPHS